MTYGQCNQSEFLVCNVCFVSFPAKLFVNHQEGKHGLAISCAYCLKEFDDLTRLGKHVSNVHDRTKVLKKDAKPQNGKDPKWKCCVCAAGYKSRESIRRHFVSQHGRWWSCDSCKLNFSSAVMLKKHTDACPNALECDMCGFKTRVRSSLIVHILRHLNLVTYPALPKLPCELCGKLFKGKRGVFKHKLRFHPESCAEWLYHCKKCARPFASAQELDAHREWHQAPRNFCDICGKPYSSKWALVIHRRIHTGEKPIACQICGKAFSSPNYLRAHGRVHAKTPNFISCRLCLQNLPPDSVDSHNETCSGSKSGEREPSDPAFSYFD